MRPILRVHALACAVLLTFAFAPAYSADITIPAGTDNLYTQPGTFFDFGGSIGIVPLVGNPIYANGTDTIVQRQGDADATTGTPITTQLVGLSLLGTGNYSNLSVTLDPNHLANDTGTMSFLVTTPITPGTEIGGTITDTLDVYFQASRAGVVIATGHEHFTSSGTWEAFLPVGSNEVTGFAIILDTHITPGGRHIVSSFVGSGVVPEPSSWILCAIAGVVVPTYAGWRRCRRDDPRPTARRRPWQTRVEP